MRVRVAGMAALSSAYSLCADGPHAQTPQHERHGAPLQQRCRTDHLVERLGDGYEDDLLAHHLQCGQRRDSRAAVRGRDDESRCFSSTATPRWAAFRPRTVVSGCCRRRRGRHPLSPRASALVRRIGDARAPIPCAAELKAVVIATDKAISAAAMELASRRNPARVMRG